MWNNAMGPELTKDKLEAAGVDATYLGSWQTQPGGIPQTGLSGYTTAKVLNSLINEEPFDIKVATEYSVTADGKIITPGDLLYPNPYIYNQVDVLVIQLGTNDSACRRRNEKGEIIYDYGNPDCNLTQNYTTNMTAIVNYFQTSNNPDINIVIASLPPSQNTGVISQDTNIQKINSLIPVLAPGLSTENSTVIAAGDPRSQFLLPNGTIDSSKYSPGDILHPSLSGSQIMSDLYTQAILGLLKNSAAPKTGSTTVNPQTSGANYIPPAQNTNDIITNTLNSALVI
jgi:lysophospholipase L1-like esterase